MSVGIAADNHPYFLSRSKVIILEIGDFVSAWQTITKPTFLIMHFFPSQPDLQLVKLQLNNSVFSPLRGTQQHTHTHTHTHRGFSSV